MNESEIIERTQTSIGEMTLARRLVEGHENVVYEIVLDGSVLMSSLSPFSEQKLATSGCAAHKGKGPLHLLIGGLGLGYTANAVLADSRVVHVTVVEQMDFCMDWMNRGLLPLSKTLLGDKRVEIIKGDIYEMVLGPPAEKVDMILIDVDHAPHAPLSDKSLPFYTAAGQQHVKKHLRAEGVLGVWSIEDHSEFKEVLEEVYGQSHHELIRWKDLEFPEADFENVLFFASND